VTNVTDSPKQLKDIGM